MRCYYNYVAAVCDVRQLYDEVNEAKEGDLAQITQMAGPGAYCFPYIFSCASGLYLWWLPGQ